MKNWFTFFRKKQNAVEINRRCGIELKSGYASIGGGLLVGKLITFENKEYRVDLKEIHFRGLYLSDPYNQLKLVVTNNDESLSLPVKIESYVCKDCGFSVLLRACDKSIEKGDYERFVNLITS